MSRTRKIAVDPLARVEGEGSLRLTIAGDRVTDARLEIYEPPRFFEALLRGRRFTEAPDLTARICGICPVAYQMSAVQAMEQALEIEVPRPVRDLRRLLYCGEWIQSHALHIHLLHAPDFLGFESGLAMGKAHPDALRRGLELKKIGNELMRVIGGREVHPINVRVGGFYRAPAPADLQPVGERLRWARDAALEAAEWVGTFEFPDFESPYELVALRHPAHYPMNGGRIVSSEGLDIPPEAFESVFAEEQVPHSTALHARVRERGIYLAGPMARFNLNADRLSPVAQEACRLAGLTAPCRNPFKTILMRAVEVAYAVDEAIRLIDAYEPPAPPFVERPLRQAQGHGCTEAPRGLLYHRYRIDDEGLIQEARIVPPTSQNQASIEDDLRRVAEGHLGLPREQLTRRCEQAIRNHDPCISCATHFLSVEMRQQTPASSSPESG